MKAAEAAPVSIHKAMPQASPQAAHVPYPTNLTPAWDATMSHAWWSAADRLDQADGAAAAAPVQTPQQTCLGMPGASDHKAAGSRMQPVRKLIGTQAIDRLSGRM